MSDTVFEVPVGRRFVRQARAHDYVYDHLFIVSGARDYARSAFKAAMNSSQRVIQPVFKTMFSELPRQHPSMRVVYHTNCRLPPHIDRSYRGYMKRGEPRMQREDLNGRDLYKYVAIPKKLLNMNVTSPDFRPPAPSPVNLPPGKPVHKKIQTVYRESSAQTYPWQPDAKISSECGDEIPEVWYLDKLEWGPGKPYRTGDLPCDFHTTEIINKMRHARQWTELVERAKFPKWMKKRDGIISDVETRDWIFREAEIDELQSIRQELLLKMQSEVRQKQANRTSKMLSKAWERKKTDMKRKIDTIHISRDREIRKLTDVYNSGGRLGLVERLRAARGGGSATNAAANPTSDQHAPLLRNGYQARFRHAHITYIPELVEFVDHKTMPTLPNWLYDYDDLQKTCSGHHIVKDKMVICERFTKWSEQFLAKLHGDLKKARLGAAILNVGPLHVLKARRTCDTPRPNTPTVDAVSEGDELLHQAALVMQRVIRGRAVQTLMYEGRRRAGELTEELKTTHGLQKEDKIRIAREEFKARDYNSLRTEAEKKDDAIQALVNEVTGGAVSAGLQFLEKELRRLKHERKQHAFILIALREKMMREAAEAGRRQKEEQRRREHDEIFKQILGLTQETVEGYLKEIVTEGVELEAEEASAAQARADADKIDATLRKQGSLSTAEQNEVVAELVQQYLLPIAHRTAARHRIANVQAARLEAAKKTIFKLFDDAEIKTSYCTQCGSELSSDCKCIRCSIMVPVEKPEYRNDPRWKFTRAYCTQCGSELSSDCKCIRCSIMVPVEKPEYRNDPRWKFTRGVPRLPPKPFEERITPYADFRSMLNDLLFEVVEISKLERKRRCEVEHEMREKVEDKLMIQLEMMDMVEAMIKDVLEETYPPVKKVDYYFHTMRREIRDALHRDTPKAFKPPEILPSAMRKIEEEKEAKADKYCKCVTYDDEEIIQDILSRPTPAGGVPVTGLDDAGNLLPSRFRMLEDMKKCKCDVVPSPEGGLEEMQGEGDDRYDPFSDYIFSSSGSMRSNE